MHREWGAVIRFAMLVLPGAFHGGIAAMLDGFALAIERRGRVVQDGEPGTADMSLTLVSRDGGPVRLDDRITIAADAAIGSARYDCVWVPAFRAGGETKLRERLAAAQAERGWLSAQADGGALLAASGSAIALLLSARLGQGMAIPVVAALAPTMRALFPRVPHDADRELVATPQLLLGRGMAQDNELVARAFDRLLSPAAGHWLRSVSGQTVTTRDGIARDPLAETARLWLEQRFAEPVSIAALAAELHVTHAALARRFVAELGTTPRGFVIDLRMATARRMLAQSRRSIDGIAAAVGYRDARSFRAQFRDRHGMSASEWRVRNIRTL